MIPPFRCASSSLRHYEQAFAPAVCELKNTCFWLRWDNTKKVSRIANCFAGTAERARNSRQLSIEVYKREGVSLLASEVAADLRRGENRADCLSGKVAFETNLKSDRALFLPGRLLRKLCKCDAAVSQ
jgi:hypothetical protein